MKDSMQRLSRIRRIEPLKIIGDSRRLEILRLLMVEAATLSQLGRSLDTHPANIRHHLKLLEEAGFVELTATRVVKGFVEKYYRATSQAYLINLAIVPGQSDATQLLAMGSHDIALEMLAAQASQLAKDTEVVPVPLGSLDGLIALKQGITHLAGCHLQDEVSGEFNQDHVRHLFPGEKMHLFTLSHREQGILVAPRNPKEIRSLNDLTRPEIAFVNRQVGSGTRQWLDRHLAEIGILSEQVNGYFQTVSTHIQVGESILAGEADVGVGLRAAALRLGLDFIPLFEERYDLVVPASVARDSAVQPILDHLQSASLRREIRKLGGYRTEHTGDERRIP
jgi:putative molybdopterin biosynthesis protein